MDTGERLRRQQKRGTTKTSAEEPGPLQEGIPGTRPEMRDRTVPETKKKDRPRERGRQQEREALRKEEDQTSVPRPTANGQTGLRQTREGAQDRGRGIRTEDTTSE